jgi:hypothetical protein
MEESKVELLAGEIKGLNPMEQIHLKSLLDNLVYVDSGHLIHSNFLEQRRKLSESAPQYSVDITLLDSELPEGEKI